MNMDMNTLEKISPFSVGIYDTKSQLQRYIYEKQERYIKQGERRRKLLNKDTLPSYQKKIRKAFLDAIGGLPDSNTPLNAEITGVIKCDGYIIQKIIFQSRPKVYVTVNMYIPDNLTGKNAAVQFLCGHSREAKGYPEYQKVCQYLVNAGFIVLAQDPVGQGERFSYYNSESKAFDVNWGVPEHDYAGIQCLAVGDGVSRYFVHDSMRGIDYLLSRPEVDPKRIGVTGNSGGGTQTSMMMLCDDRIAAAAPTTFIMNRSSYMYTGQAQDSEQIWKGFTSKGFDHEDILLAFAPKPLIVNAVTYDFFPIEGTRQSYNNVRHLWNDGDIAMEEDVSTHMYTDKLAKKSAEFFARHLLGKNNVIFKDNVIKMLDPTALFCTDSGQLRDERLDAKFIFEENLQRIKSAEVYRNGVNSEKGKKWLSDLIFKDRTVSPLNERLLFQSKIDDFNAEGYMWLSQKNMMNYGVLMYLGDKKDIKEVYICLWDGGTAKIAENLNVIKEKCCDGNGIFIVDLSGLGNLTPNPISPSGIYEPYGTLFKFADDLIWTDDSIAALRSYEFLTAMDLINSFGYGIKLYLSGKYGILGLYASLVSKYNIKSIEKHDLYNIEKNCISRLYASEDLIGIIIPGILKYFDIK